jgi:hypothetical protein
VRASMAESNPRFVSNPIAVVDYDVGWPDEFARERQRILKLVGPISSSWNTMAAPPFPGWPPNRSSTCWLVCTKSTRRQSQHVRFTTSAIRTSAFKYPGGAFLPGAVEPMKRRTIAEEWRMTGNWKLGAFAIILAAFSSKSASTAGCVGRSTHYQLLVDVSGTPTQATRPGEKIGSTRRHSVCDAAD